MSTRAERLKKKDEKSKLSCKKPDCPNDRHSYSQAPKSKANRRKLLDSAGMSNASAIEEPFGRDLCWACGDSSIQWDVPRKRDPKIIPEIVKLLRKEAIRSVYWVKEFDDEARKGALKKGKEQLLDKDIRKRLHDALSAKPFRDGMQTPWSGNVLFYAQHATATCCRKCLEQWHGIRQGTELTEEMLEYLENLVRHYLESRSVDIWGQSEQTD